MRRDCLLSSTSSQSIHSDAATCEVCRGGSLDCTCRRLGHMGKSAMAKLGMEELARGLEGGMAVQWTLW